MIDSQAEAVLRDMQAQSKPMPDDEAEWLQGYRAQLDALPRLQGPPPWIEVAGTSCPGPAGTVPLRAYRPKASGTRPTVVFCHGSGLVAGTLDGYDVPLRPLTSFPGCFSAARHRVPVTAV